MKTKKPKKLAAKIILKAENLCDFETKMYSRMKYGDPVSTKRIALNLTSAIINHPFIQKIILSEEPIIITSSAFGVIPTASYSIAREVTKLLQSMDVKYDRIKFERGGDFATNHYGTMSLEERTEAMNKRQIFLSQTDKEKIKNKYVLIIDDISVTGSHEKKLHQLLSESGAKDWIFAYYYLLGKKIATQSPETEEDLNRSEVRTVLDLIPFFKDYSKNVGYKLRLNSRALKFILTTSPESVYDVDAYTKEAHLKYFFKKIDDIVLARLYKAINSSDGYHLDPKYATGINLLNEEIRQRDTLHKFLTKIKHFLNNLGSTLHLPEQEIDIITSRN